MVDQNSPIGGFTPTPPPSGGATPTSGSGYGVPSGYQPTEGLQTSLLTFAPGQAPQGAVGTGITQFGTDAQASQYTEADALTIPLADPQGIPQLQGELVQAGLLNPRTVRLGVWDAESINAYKRVLQFANIYGMNANDALAALVQNPTAAHGGTAASGGGSPASYFFPEYNPAEVTQGFQQTSQQLTGGYQNPDAVNAFQSYFTGQEAAAAQGKDIAKAQRGGQYEQKPSPSAAAEQYLRSSDPQQVQAYGTASRALDFFKMLGAQ